jgi:hypothetical protein
LHASAIFFSLWSRSAVLISRLKNIVSWFVVREKYCSGWKNKLKKTDYKPSEHVRFFGDNYSWTQNKLGSETVHRFKDTGSCQCDCFIIWIWIDNICMTLLDWFINSTGALWVLGLV